MAVEVTPELTRKIADLARLELSEKEVATFTGQLGDILKYIDSLQAVDVSKVEPLTHPIPLETPMREDVIVPSPVDAQGKPKVLSCAPEVLYDGFKVPPIL